ncbi:MAG: Winged helix DNA-binding domain protein, partial [Clostridia bacterium]|nr:Winged helix DNA-binding domain protein [Clostridia bacterium]
ITSSDLKLDQIIDWAWAPTRLSRAALESMYLWGELIICSKANSRKQYDFAHKHIPEHILDCEDPNRTLQEYHDWHVLRRIGAVGLLWNKSGDAWLGIKELKSKERNEAIERLLEKNRIIEIHVENIKYPLYMKKEYEDLFNDVLSQEPAKARGAFLAPLDNMIWDRKLIKELFDFEYRWEVYKPAAQRQYGYYVLPVLYGSRFVARFEPILDKQTGTLIIKNWWWEPDVKRTIKMCKELKRCMKGFMNFTETQSLKIEDNALATSKLDWLLE